MNYIYDQNVLADKIFDFIYGCAMHDAILQRAFEGKKDWVGKVKTARPFLREYIGRIIDDKFSSPEEHDAYFLETANKICKEINGNKPAIAKDAFSFGNAQKLINIAVKHAYSFCYYAPGLREHFRYCHCPLDSIMLNRVWNLYKQEMGEARRKDKLKNMEYFCQSWGKEGQEGKLQPEIMEFPERYCQYQAAIRELIGDNDLYPIEFDYLVWKDEENEKEGKE